MANEQAAAVITGKVIFRQVREWPNGRVAREVTLRGPGGVKVQVAGLSAAEFAVMVMGAAVPMPPAEVCRANSGRPLPSPAASPVLMGALATLLNQGGVIPGLCKDRQPDVRLDGGCLACPADQGERCRRGGL